MIPCAWEIREWQREEAPSKEMLEGCVGLLSKKQSNMANDQTAHPHFPTCRVNCRYCGKEMDSLQQGDARRSSRNIDRSQDVKTFFLFKASVKENFCVIA